jgi:hypothetical protein
VKSAEIRKFFFIGMVQKNIFKYLRINEEKNVTTTSGLSESTHLFSRLGNIIQDLARLPL